MWRHKKRYCPNVGVDDSKSAGDAVDLDSILVPAKEVPVESLPGAKPVESVVVNTTTDAETGDAMDLDSLLVPAKEVPVESLTGTKSVESLSDNTTTDAEIVKPGPSPESLSTKETADPKDLTAPRRSRKSLILSSLMPLKTKPVATQSLDNISTLSPVETLDSTASKLFPSDQPESAKAERYFIVFLIPRQSFH
ncbi:MAG: hypothetical protein SGCHY_004660 [Lobulomycetales sp.]